MRKPVVRANRSKFSQRNKHSVLSRAVRSALPCVPFEKMEGRQLFAIVQPAGLDYLAFEAEDPQAVFVDLADADTDSYVRVTGDAALGATTAPTGGAAIRAVRAGGTSNDAGSVTYPIQLNAAGTYRLYARVKYNAGDDNSQYVPPTDGDIGAAATATYGNNNVSVGNYNWNVAQTFNYNNPTADATTTLTFNIRENNYIVDRVVLSRNLDLTAEQLDQLSPQTLRVTSARSTTANAISVAFTSVADATGYNIYRSTSAAGPFAKVNTDPVTETTFLDTPGTAGQTFFYQVAPVTAAGEGARTATASAVVGQGLVGHYFDDGFWGNGDGNRPANPFVGATEVGGTIKVLREGEVVEFVPQVAFDYGDGTSGTPGSPAPGVIPNDNHSTVFVGKIVTNEAGAYQIAGFGDDDTHVYVNGVLVSSDPGGHGIPGNAAEIDFKRTLALGANTAYDVVVVQAEGGGGSGIFLRWTTPSSAAYTNVPSANLNQQVSAPVAPSGVTRDTATRVNGVEIDFTDNATNELRYELQRSTDGVAFTSVASRAGVTGINGTTLIDPTAVAGQTYQYRVLAVNFEGSNASAPITVTATQPVASAGATAYYFNTQYWGDTAAPTPYQVSVADVTPDFSETVPQINFNYGDSSPRPGIINNDQHSTVFTGKIRVTETGSYQFLAFTDDDSYLWVNNQLVSADPGGHGIPGNAAEIDFRRPITLTAGQDYNFVALQAEGGGGSGIILRYSTPSNNAIVDIPASVFVGNIPNAGPDKASGAPADPTGLGFREVGSSRAVLTFNDVSANELRYNLEKSTTADFSGAETIRLPINSTSYVDTTLAAGTRYYYRLRAENYFGDSATTAPVTFSTLASGEAAPAAPTNATARPRSTGILVSFVDNSFFEEGFTIQRSEGGGAFTDQPALAVGPGTGSGSALSVEDTTVIAGTSYSYRVIATSANGNSAPSNVATATAGGQAGTGLQATYFNERFFSGPGTTLANPADAEEDFGAGSPDAAIEVDTFSGVLEGTFLAETTERYTFLTGSDDGIALRLIDPRTNTVLIDFDNTEALRGLPPTGFQDVAGSANLEAGVRYQIQVRFTENGGGAGYRVGFSTPTTPAQVIPAELLFTPTGTEAIQAPQRLRFISAVGTEDITLAFEDLSISETGFEVERGTSATGPFTVVGTLSPDAGRFIDRTGTVVPGTTYFYRVRTLGATPSAFTAPVAVTPVTGGTGLTFNGTATYLNGADNVRGTTDDAVRLTDNVNGQTGSVFTTNVRDVLADNQGTGGTTNGFTAQFDFRIPEATGNPADGFAFVIQRNNPNALGGGGGGIGYAGVGNSLAVAFDLFPDAANANPGANETALFVNGEVNDAGQATGLVFNNGNTYRAVLSYDAATKTLTQTITNQTVAGQSFTTSYTLADGPGAETPELDLPAILGGEFAFVGFTGATGGLNAETQISNFTFNGVQLIPQANVVSPTIDAVYVRNAAWSADFKTFLEAKGLGDDVYGYRVDGVTTTLPWINMNQVVLRYSGPISAAGLPTAGSVIFDGQQSDYTVTTVEQLDPQTVVLTLNRALGIQPAGSPDITLGDRVKLTVPGGGAAGSAYNLTLNVLQGDADRAANQRVATTDVNFVKARLNRNSTEVPPAGAAYTAFADLNGDGRILTADINAAKARLNDVLPPAATTTGSVATASITRDLFSSTAII